MTHPDPPPFLHQHERRKLPIEDHPGLKSHGLFLGQGSTALEVIVLSAGRKPKVETLRGVWNTRQKGRAAPLLAIALHGDAATICGPAGDNPRCFTMQRAQAERLSARALGEPDRNAALRYLRDALPATQTDTLLPGFRNEGLLTDHVLREHAASPKLDLATAQARSRAALGARDQALLQRLGFGVARLDDATHVLRAGDEKRAVAVLLLPDEVEEVAAERFQRISPIQWALDRADKEGLPWVVTVQADRIRLYPRALDVGVGRRGRTDTWIEVRTDLMREDQVALLWLIFSSDALRAGGSIEHLLADSRRFATRLADDLRERIYDRVVPRLAEGIARARNVEKPDAAALRLTYTMALTVLFRLLFIAYAEDRDFLPYAGNHVYRRRALKTRAHELQEGALPAGPGDQLWREVALLWDAVRDGNPAWGVVAYGGGLFADDPAISSAGAALAGITLPDQIFRSVLRDLLLDMSNDLGDTSKGPVDFRSLRVAEFGTIYEGLLESELAVAETDLTTKRDRDELVYVPARVNDPVAVRRGEIYLHSRSGARKSSGSYFTPEFAVEHLLDAALTPALQAHRARLDLLDDDAAAGAFFDLRIADIAMGSGHFLVRAIDRVEQALSSYLKGRALPGVMNELSALHEAADGQLKAVGMAGSLLIEPAQLLRRMIARRCIYGIDLNPPAVELARLSVWIHTFVPGLPLTLLDHHLVAGNALVGIATLQDAKAQLTALAGVGLSVEPQQMLLAAEPFLAQLARISDASLQDVLQSRRAHAAATDAAGAAASLFDAAVAVRIGHALFRPAANVAI